MADEASSADYIETVGYDARGMNLPWGDTGEESANDAGWFGSSALKKVRKGVSNVVKSAASAPLSVVKSVGVAPLSIASQAVSRVGLPAVSQLMRAPELLLKTASSSGQAAMSALSKANPAKFTELVQGGLRELSANPAWDLAKTGASLLPGVGTAVSSGMAAASALGRGASLKDTVLEAARSAIPGGAAATAAFDVAVGLARGEGLSDAAIAAARSQLPGGDAAKAAFDGGLALARRSAGTADTMQVVRDALPVGSDTTGVFDDMMARAGSVTRQRNLPDFNDLSAGGNQIARALMSSPRLRRMRTVDIARELGVRPGLVKSATAAMLQRFAGRDVGWEDVGDFETADTAADRLEIRMPLPRGAPSLTAGNRGRPGVMEVVKAGDTWGARGRPAPLGRRIVLPRMQPSRSFLMRLAQCCPSAERAVRSSGLLATIARNTGELTGPKTWTIRSGDFPSGVAQKVTGNAGRWKEILASNPTMTTYTDANGSTQIKPWQVGQTFVVPDAWVGATAPPATTPPLGGLPGLPGIPAGLPGIPAGLPGLPAGTTPSLPAVAGGPPFPPPSKYPGGYPGPTYTVVSGDYASSIASKITGDGQRWKELLPLNPERTPSNPTDAAKYGMMLYAGNVLKLPSNWQAAAAPALPPGVTPPPLVVGTPQQVTLIQAMLLAFHAKHPEAGFPLKPMYGSQPIEDSSGIWTQRSQAAMKSFQVWANLKGKNGGNPLNEDGYPDNASVTALQAVVQSELAPVATPPAQPPAGPPVATPPGVPPGLIPPGLIPPGVIPPGVIPPGVVPPGVVPPAVIPPGVIPPGLKPPIDPPKKDSGGGGAVLALLAAAAALLS
jgi:nucleoid-associated protein YgaU